MYDIIIYKIIKKSTGGLKEKTMNYHNCLEELIKSISFPAMVLDEGNMIILKNAVEASGDNLPIEGSIGKTFFDLFPHDQARLLHDGCQSALNSKQPAVQPIRFTTPDRYSAATNIKMIPFFNPDTLSWYMICVIEEKSNRDLGKIEIEINENSIKNDERKQPNDETDIEEARAALRFLLKEGANQITTLKEETFKKLANQILPHIEGLKSSQLNQNQLAYAEMIESNVKKMSEPFIRRISDPLYKLSPSELKIASLIRGGKSNKEMAKILNLSKSTILTHRHHLRAKLGLKNKKENLRSFLDSLGSQERISKKTQTRTTE
jgi:DNA-binding CsgD family transcriptional regulator